MKNKGTKIIMRHQYSLSSVSSKNSLPKLFKVYNDLTKISSATSITFRCWNNRMILGWTCGQAYSAGRSRNRQHLSHFCQQGQTALWPMDPFPLRIQPPFLTNRWPIAKRQRPYTEIGWIAVRYLYAVHRKYSGDRTPCARMDRWTWKRAYWQCAIR